MPQGRLLGGSGALNGMNFVPPAQEELNAWAGLGNPGWDWEGVSKYLNKSYTLTSGAKTENDGVLQVNVPEEDTKCKRQTNHDNGSRNLADMLIGPQLWRDTFAGLGFPAKNTPSSGHIYGVVSYADAIHPATKTRSYSANAYFAPARSRANLTLWTGVSVDKVLFEKTPDGAVAIGIQYTKDGKVQTVSSGKEVILSAGTFHSPKILELSGIGDAERLQKLGIDVVVANPYVGENLQNHPMCTLTFELSGDDDKEEGFETIDALARQDPAALGAAMEAYTAKQRGPFSQTNSNVTAHIPFPGITTDDGKRDLAQILERHISGATTADVPGSKATPEYTQAHHSLIRSVLTSPTTASGYYISFAGWAAYGPTGAMVPIPTDSVSPSQKYFTIGVVLTHPLSRGSSHVTTTRTTDPPAIDPNYLAHPLDTEILARHVRFLESTLAAAPPLASRLKKSTVDVAAPAGWPRGFSTDLDQARRFVREVAVGASHYAGTCSMMPRGKGGVVDDRLRVYGTKGLRVVDASVMPFVTRANPMAAVYAVAEKAADVIREDYGW